MLRRSCCILYIHRTLTGIIIKGQDELLDGLTNKLKLTNTSPAVYWVTHDVVSQHHIQLSAEAENHKALVPFDAVAHKDEVAETADHDATEVDQEEEESSSMVSLYPLEKSNSPRLRPVHHDSRGRKIPREGQSILEMIAAKRGYSSTTWMTIETIVKMNKTVVKKFDEVSGKEITQRPIPIVFSGSGRDMVEKKFFNSDVVVSRKDSPDESKEMDQDHILKNFDQASDAVLDSLGDLQRSGTGRVLPQQTASELARVKKERGFKSNKWFTTYQLIELNLKPKSGETFISVTRTDGALFKCFNGDQLELGMELHEMVKLKKDMSQSMMATDEMERRAAKAGIFLDHECIEIFQQDRLEAVKKAFARREDPTASRQYLNHWSISQLGYEVDPSLCDSMMATYFTQGGIRIDLYNRDDCLKRQAKKKKFISTLILDYPCEEKEQELLQPQVNPFEAQVRRVCDTPAVSNENVVVVKKNKTKTVGSSAEKLRKSGKKKAVASC